MTLRTVARDTDKRPHDLLDRAVLLKIGAPYLADHVHANHPHNPSRPIRAKGKDADTTRQKGSELDAKSPLRGSILRAILQPDRDVFGGHLGAPGGGHH